MKLLPDALNNSPTANLIAKSFLVGYAGQAVLTFGPMLGDPGALIVQLTSVSFDYAFFNNALGKALVAAWAILLSNPFEDMAPSSTTMLKPGPIRATDLKDK